MSDDSRLVVVENRAGVRTITLNRPKMRNAFNAELLTALRGAVEQAASDAAVRCIVITGAGRAFSSGQDLAELREHYESGKPIELGARLCREYHPIIAKIRMMEKPVVAGVNGAAIGAGCSLALACDLRVAAESASFCQGFINVGLVPGSGSTFMLPRLVGMARAAELAFTGRMVRAAEALDMGLVNRVVPDEDLMKEAMTLAGTLAEKPAKAMSLTKRALNAAWTSDVMTQLDLESELQAAAGETPDHREGVLAFLEKRRPRFEGVHD